MIGWLLGCANDDYGPTWKAAVFMIAMTALMWAPGIAAVTAAQTTAQPALVDPYAMTTKRLLATFGGVVALGGAVTGGLAMVRSRRRAGTALRSAKAALFLGLLGAAIGGMVIATANGGLGTGNGLGGGVVAMIVGLVGAALGGLALARSRHIT